MRGVNTASSPQIASRLLEEKVPQSGPILVSISLLYPFPPTMADEQSKKPAVLIVGGLGMHPPSYPLPDIQVILANIRVSIF